MNLLHRDTQSDEFLAGTACSWTIRLSDPAPQGEILLAQRPGGLETFFFSRLVVLHDVLWPLRVRGFARLGSLARCYVSDWILCILYVHMVSTLPPWTGFFSNISISIDVNPRGTFFFPSFFSLPPATTCRQLRVGFELHDTGTRVVGFERAREYIKNRSPHNKVRIHPLWFSPRGCRLRTRA